MSAPLFTQPWWLAAGAAALLVPIVLHLIAPRPPARAPLPTARFVEPQARARRYLTRRPRDPLLLALRCLFLALLFMALAGPRVAPPRSGTTGLLLVDARADAETVEAARARAGDPIVIATDSLADYAAVLARLPRAAFAETRAESVRVTWVAPFSWAAWTPGTSALRTAWPGAITLIDVPLPPADTAPSRGTAAVLASGEPERALALALGALGYAVGDDASSADVVVIVGPAPPDTTPQDATLIVAAGEGEQPTRTLFAADFALHDIAGSAIQPTGGERVLASWDDGGIAAVAGMQDGRCVARTGVDLRHSSVLGAPELPALLDLLARGCARAEPARRLPLDGAARALLAGTGLPDAVAVDALPGSNTAGVSLVRWLLLAALLVAAAETLVAARRDRGTTGAPAGTSRA